MDRDTGSIGGIERPPLPSKQLFQTTIILDVTAILLGFLISPLFVVISLFYIGASKAYSFRGLRLKRFPVIGYLTVILFQGGLTFWLVYYGCSKELTIYAPWEGIVICTLLIGGFYPLTQIYQHQQDLADGVETLSYKLGYSGTFIFCALVYILALILMSFYFVRVHETNKLGLVGIFFVPIVVYFIRWFLLVQRDPANANFKSTMKMNWLAAICTNSAFIILLIWRFFE